MKLMVEKGFIDPTDESVCVDMENFPNLKINLEDGNHELNSIGGGKSLLEKRRLQDESAKKIITMLNNARPEGSKLHVLTTGYADGARNLDKSYDEKILRDFSVNGQLSAKKIEEVLRQYDPVAVDVIKAEIKAFNVENKRADDQDIPFTEIPNDSRLKSLLRNHVLAKSRGENLCKSIFSDPSSCEAAGVISPNLDKGKACLDGCCDGRRGAVIDVTVPEIGAVSLPGNGTYKPPFVTPVPQFQSKIQMAGSLSVFSLPLKEDLELEKDVIVNGNFGPELLEKDRARFREAMKDTGCSQNDFAVDSVRRLYWSIKNQKDSLPKDFYDAVISNDFKKVFSLYRELQKEKKLSGNVAGVISTLFSGGASSNLRAPKTCPKTKKIDKSWVKDFKEDWKQCQISPNSDPGIEQFLRKKSDGMNMWNLLNSKELENNDDLYLFGDSDKKGNLYLYDSKVNKSYFFSFDPNCAALIGAKPDLRTKEVWVSQQSPESKIEMSLSCFQKKVGLTSGLRSDFFPFAVSDKGGIVGTDVFNCLDISKALDSELQNQDVEKKGIKLSKTARDSQKPYCLTQSDDQVSLYINTTDFRHGVGGRSGFMCTGCGSGMPFDSEINKIVYKSRERDQAKDDDSLGDREIQATQTFYDAMKKIKQNPLSLSSIKHMRSYLIPACGETCEDACACLREGNIKELISRGTTIAHDFSDVSKANGGSKRTIFHKDGPKSFACIFTPPVPHTCSFNPVGETPTEESLITPEELRCPLQEALEKLPTVAPFSEVLVRKYQDNCSTKTFPVSEESCLKDQGGICRRLKHALEDKGCPAQSTQDPQSRKTSIK